MKYAWKFGNDGKFTEAEDPFPEASSDEEIEKKFGFCVASKFGDDDNFSVTIYSKSNEQDIACFMTWDRVFYITFDDFPSIWTFLIQASQILKLNEFLQKE